MKKGEFLDFTVDCGPKGNFSCDGFLWSPTLKQGETEWRAEKEFGGTITIPVQLTVWERYAQALLLSNEFIYVD